MLIAVGFQAYETGSSKAANEGYEKLKYYERHHRTQLKNFPSAFEEWLIEDMPNALTEKFTSMEAFTNALLTIGRAAIGYQAHEGIEGYLLRENLKRFANSFEMFSYGGTSAAFGEFSHQFLGTRRDSGIVMFISWYFFGGE